MSFSPLSPTRSDSKDDLWSRMRSPSVAPEEAAAPEVLDLSKFRNMIDIIASVPQYAVELGKCVDTANLDQLAKALLNIGTYKGTTCKMINEMIAKEFNTTQEHTILRGNSVTTKLEMLFCREQGKSYLKTLFGQTVLRLVTDCDLNLATTITKLENVQGAAAETRIEENRQRILDVAQEFVDTFTDEKSINEMPPAIRAIAAYTAHHASIHYPNNVTSYLSGFILLRFFNPAIITPESLGMLPDGVVPDNQDRQNLIAITRIIQKLANQTLTAFGNDDTWINPFIELNRDKISNYFLHICEDPFGDDPPYSRFITTTTNEIVTPRNQFLSPKGLTFLHECIYKYGIALFDRFKDLPPVVRNGIEYKLEVELIKLILEIGPPLNTNKVLTQLTRKEFSSSDSAFLLPVRQSIREQGIPPRIGQSCVVGNNLVYFFGGMRDTGEMVEGDDSFLVYNISSSLWKNEGTQDAPIRKFHAAVHSLKGMYIFGGTLNKIPKNDIWFYQYKTKTWKQIHSRNQAPHPRYGHSMIISNERLYVFGGYSQIENRFYYNNQLCIFDLRSLHWKIEELNASPSPRMHHSAVPYKNSMLIFGGRTPDMEGTCDLHLYDICKNTWTTVACQGDIPTPRWSHSMTIFDDQRLLVFGGCSSCEYYKDLYEFTFKTNTWRLIPISSALNEMKEGMSSHSAIVLYGKLKLFFGGTYELKGTLSKREHLLSIELYPNYGENVATDWKQLLNQRELSDVCFIADDQVIFAHLLVLYTRCPKLYDIAVATGSKQLEITGISYRLLHDILNYIYCNELPSMNHLDEILRLIMWAKRFELISLLDKLETVLYNMLNEKNLAAVLHTAEKYEMVQLEVACTTYLLSLPSKREFPFSILSTRTLRHIACHLFPTATIKHFEVE